MLDLQLMSQGEHSPLIHVRAGSAIMYTRIAYSASGSSRYPVVVKLRLPGVGTAHVNPKFASVIYLLLFPIIPLMILLCSLFLSTSLFSISSHDRSCTTGPYSSLSNQSLQTPLSPFAPDRLLTLGALGVFSHLACSSGCVARKRRRSRASFLCRRISSVMAWAIRGMASPLRPRSLA